MSAPNPITLRPLAVGDEAALLRIHEHPEVLRWWHLPAAGFPWDEPESTRFTILVESSIAGLVQFWEEAEPDFRHAGIDLFVDPSWHGRGIGTAVVRRVVSLLVRERGHHRVVIDPAAANAAAIRTYQKAGFKAVGVMRRAERDTDGEGWRDCLLMELLASEVEQPATDEPAVELLSSAPPGAGGGEGTPGRPRS